MIEDILINHPNAQFVVGVSGGKDSTLTAAMMLEKFGKRCRLVFCDTGIEAPQTYEYVKCLDRIFFERYGVNIETIKNDFSERLQRKRNKLIKNGFEKQASLKIPRGNPFLDLCVASDRFPSRVARFCSYQLKIRPTENFIKNILMNGITCISVSGERAEESIKRAGKPVFEDWKVDKKTGTKAYIYRPILGLKTQDVFEGLARFNIEPNPLYKLGFTRVGCFHCINCRKEELRLIAEHSPETIDKLEQWEKLVGASRCDDKGATFFHLRQAHGAQNIREAVEWSKTSRGGKQYPLIFEDQET